MNAKWVANINHSLNENKNKPIIRQIVNINCDVTISSFTKSLILLPRKYNLTVAKWH